MDKEWLKNKVLERGRGAQRELASALKCDPTIVNKMLHTGRKITADEAEIIRSVVAGWEAGQTPAISAANDTGREPKADYPQIDVTHLAPYQGRPDVPVWAAAQAGEDGAIVLTPDPIDYIHRSDRMRGVKNPFAFYIVGSSMSPAIEPGIQVVINPSLPPMSGRDHVFIQDLPDGTMKAMVKRLVRATEKAWRVRQYNEPKDFDLPRSSWPKAYRISEKRED